MPLLPTERRTKMAKVSGELVLDEKLWLMLMDWLQPVYLLIPPPFIHDNVRLNETLKL